MMGKVQTWLAHAEGEEGGLTSHLGSSWWELQELVHRIWSWGEWLPVQLTDAVGVQGLGT